MSLTSTSTSGIAGLGALIPPRLYDDDEVVQATDGGRPTLVASRLQIEVPPSYDPAWKDDGPASGTLEPLSESPRTLTPVAEPTLSPFFAPSHGPSPASTPGTMPDPPPLTVGAAKPLSPPPQMGAILPRSPIIGAAPLSDRNQLSIASSVTTIHRSSMASGDRTSVASTNRRSLPPTPSLLPKSTSGV